MDARLLWNRSNSRATHHDFFDCGVEDLEGRFHGSRIRATHAHPCFLYGKETLGNSPKLNFAAFIIPRQTCPTCQHVRKPEIRPHLVARSPFPDLRWSRGRPGSMGLQLSDGIQRIGYPNIGDLGRCLLGILHDRPDRFWLPDIGNLPHAPALHRNSRSLGRGHPPVD